MADRLEIHLGGSPWGRPVTTRDIDFSELRPLIDSLEEAAIVESGIDTIARDERRARGPARSLPPVRFSLDAAFTPENGREAGAIYHFTVGSETVAAVGRITAGLAGSTGVFIEPEAAQAVRKGLLRTINRGLSVQLINGSKTPVFSRANPPPPLPAHPVRKFDTEIAVKILRVGGKKRLARVLLLGSKQEATVELGSEKQARELGTHLYLDAVLKGSSEWTIDPDRFSTPKRLLKFAVSTYRLLAPTTNGRVIDEMTQATGGIWDDVDPTDPEQVEDTAGDTSDLP
jgi:hypothetical protein